MPTADIKKKFIDWELLCKKWLHSRKAVIFLVVITLGSAALTMHRIDGGQWVDLIKWATAGYMAGNAAGSVADALGSNKDNS